MNNVLEGKEPMSLWANYVVMLLAIMLIIMLKVYIVTNYVEVTLNQYGEGALLMGVFYFAGWQGFKNVPIGFNGVPGLFGQRLKLFTLPEGWIWLLPFMTLETIDVRERTKDIREFVVISKNNIRMRVESQILWKVVHPYRTLSIGEDVIGNAEEGNVEAAIKALVIRMIRMQVLTYTDKELMTGKMDIEGDATLTTNNISKRWGVWVVQILVIKIVPVNEKVMSAWEEEGVEQRQKITDKIDREALIASIEEISNNGNNMSPEMAAMVELARRGKEMPTKKIVIDDQSTRGIDPLLKAAVVHKNT